MFVAFVAKTIFKSKNGVVTPFKSATNLRQTSDAACRKSFLNEIVTSIGTIVQKKATADAVQLVDKARFGITRAFCFDFLR